MYVTILPPLNPEYSCYCTMVCYLPPGDRFTHAHWSRDAGRARPARGTHAHSPYTPPLCGGGPKGLLPTAGARKKGAKRPEFLVYK